MGGAGGGTSTGGSGGGVGGGGGVVDAGTMGGGGVGGGPIGGGGGVGGGSMGVGGTGGGPIGGVGGKSMPPMVMAAMQQAASSGFSSGGGSVIVGSAGTGGLVTGPIGGFGGSPGGNEDPFDPMCATVPIGFWRFDDCNTARTDLQDSSFQGHSAFRNVDLTCPAGQEGLAVSFGAVADQVYAPDQPDFVLDHGMTIAAWVKPTRVDQLQTLFRKRDDANSAFALLINAKRFQYVVRLTSGRLVTVTAPAQAGVWTHVAATYDGKLLKLYLNGVEAARTKATGTIVRGLGPLLMGNDIAGRRFNGLLDNAWFNTLAAPDNIILKLTCVHKPLTISVSPMVGPAVDPGTDVTYTMSLMSTDSPICDPTQFETFVSVPGEFTASNQFQFLTVPAGQTVTSSVDVASGEETDPGTYPIDFFFLNTSNFTGGFVQIEAQYVVKEPTGCHVTTSKELTIRDLSVVEDPIRTSLDGDPTDPRTGAWTFGHLMQQLSPSDAAGPDVTEAMFRSFLSTQTINGFSVGPRPNMDPVVLQPWPRTQDNKLDLARAPMRLLAIVNRLDLKRLDQGKAGEGRIVFGVLDSSGLQLQFTVILEYFLPAANEQEFDAWANRFHALQALPFPSEQYNAALQAITDSFAGRGAIPGNPNGSALIDIRTNEIALSDVWQLREFHLSPTNGFLDPATLFLTPDSSFNNTDTLARFINANEATILTETHVVPPTFEDAPFQAGAVFNNIDFWSAGGINNPEARHKFSLNTCNGCHGGETDTAFLQINPRDPGQVSALAGFQTGITVFDPVTQEQRRFAELSRRRKLLESVVCATPQP